MTEPLNLIDVALTEARNERLHLDTLPNIVKEPLFPEARRNVFYLRTRTSLMKGCRKAVKLIDINWKRSIAYSILTQALQDIFQYGKDERIITHYNAVLDDMIGTH